MPDPTKQPHPDPADASPLHVVWTPGDTVDLAFELAHAPAEHARPHEDHDIQRARRAIHDMHVEMATWDTDDAEGRYIAALIQLLQHAVDDAAGLKAMTARAQARSSGDHSWMAQQRPEWTTALLAVTAWEEAHP